MRAACPLPPLRARCDVSFFVSVADEYTCCTGDTEGTVGEECGDCCEDHTWVWIFWIMMVLIWLGCCIASWTFGVIGFCNAPKLGTGQPLCCSCSAACVFGANAGLAGGNCCMLIFYLIIVLGVWGHPDIGGIVTYIVLTGITATAAVMLHQKKAQWNVPVGVQPVNHSVMASGRNAATGQVTMGAPVMGQPVLGQPMTLQPVGQPVMGQPVAGQAVMVNGQLQPMTLQKTF